MLRADHLKNADLKVARATSPCVMHLHGLLARATTALLSLSMALACCAAEPIPFEQRQSPYSMVYYHLSKDEQTTRALLSSIRDMGVTRTLALVYWWQCDTLGGDFWKKDYRAEDLNEGARRALDNYIRISRELGMKPSLRLGSFREWNGLWHPADPSGSVEHYAAWVGQLAAQYKGQVDHYIIGDEENRAGPGGYDGSPKQYLEKMFVPLARAIRAADPDAKISTCGVSAAPDTQWLRELIQLGLPRYGDGVACNLWYGVVEDVWQIENFMRDIRAVWPEAKFYSSGVGYAINRGTHDDTQAGIVAQTMFTLWDVGWDAAPYYLYGFSVTADTKQNYGLIDITAGEGQYVRTDAWKAYQTIAQTFYNRDELKSPGFDISVAPAERLTAEDGTDIFIAPPSPVVRAYVRGDSELLIYVAYRTFREPRDGLLRITVHSNQWSDPQCIDVLDYTKRHDVKHHQEDGAIVLDEVQAGLRPAIIVLRKASQ